MGEHPGAEQSWVGFWGGSHSIYVNARHADVHYRRIAADVARLLAHRQQPRVLDWGCGDALHSPIIAAGCDELLLYDAVPAVRERLVARFGNARGIHVLDDKEWRELPPGSIDVVVFNSVAQYLTRDELERLLDAFRRVTSGQGEVLLADIIPPDAGMLPDALSLLRAAWKHGFLLAACGGLVRTFFSEYRKVRRQAGFSIYSASGFTRLLDAHGFTAERLPNIGFSRQRMTFRARPLSSS